MDHDIPLKALRAFEAAARHMSFTKAAEELRVTTGAISHQIKMLEDALRVKLFHRGNQSLTLTAPGAELLPDVRASFRILSRATERLAGRADGTRLVIAVPPTFGSRWLASRILNFSRTCPDITVDIVAANPLLDVCHTGFDVAIRYGPIPQAGYESELVAIDDIFPVCSPKLCEGADRPRTPADLKKQTLLHYPCMLKDHVFTDWRAWLSLAGVEDVDNVHGPTFFPGNMALDAAVAGNGVALGKGIVVADELADGRLIRLFEIDVGLRCEYHLVYPKAAVDHPSHRAFRDWLKRELRADSEELLRRQPVRRHPPSGAGTQSLTRHRLERQH